MSTYPIPPRSWSQPPPITFSPGRHTAVSLVPFGPGPRRSTTASGTRSRRRAARSPGPAYSRSERPTGRSTLQRPSPGRAWRRSAWPYGRSAFVRSSQPSPCRPSTPAWRAARRSAPNRCLQARAKSDTSGDDHRGAGKTKLPEHSFLLSRGPGYRRRTLHEERTIKEDAGGSRGPRPQSLWPSPSSCRLPRPSLARECCFRSRRTSPTTTQRDPTTAGP